MSIITVGDVWTRIKQRADVEKAGSTGFVSDQEGINLIQLGTTQLQNLVMDTYESWLARYVIFTTVVNQLSYPVNTIGMPDFYKLLGIGITTNSTSPQDSWMPLEHFERMNMNLPAGGFIQFTSGFFTDMRYMVSASDKGVPQIELRPVKSATQLGVYYVPRPPQFASLKDELPPWIMPGWEEYMVAFGAWMVAGKERTGTQTHKEIWQMVERQIEMFAPNHDSFRPPIVTSGWMYNRSTPFWMSFYGRY